MKRQEAPKRKRVVPSRAGETSGSGSGSGSNGYSGSGYSGSGYDSENLAVAGNAAETDDQGNDLNLPHGSIVDKVRSLVLFTPTCARFWSANRRTRCLIFS